MNDLNNVQNSADQNHPNFLAEAIWVGIIFFVIRGLWNWMFPVKQTPTGTSVSVNWLAVGIVAVGVTAFCIWLF